MSGNVTVTANWNRFLDNGDGTVTDVITNLVWLKNGNADGSKSWYNATTWCDNLANGTAGLSDGSGAGDWRLPTEAELAGLISGWTGASIGEWLAAQGFVDVNLVAYYYWTSDTYTPNGAEFAYIVSFATGIPNWAIKYNTHINVRAVKGGISYVLEIAKAGGGSGTVTSQDSVINCGSECSGTYSSGAVVQLTAVATSGSTFTGWSGGGCSGTGTCTVTMSDDITVTATFTAPVTTTTTVRFQDNSDGTVTDTVTNLIWLKNGNADGSKPWANAMAWCSSLASGTAGLSDVRRQVIGVCPVNQNWQACSQGRTVLRHLSNILLLRGLWMLTLWQTTTGPLMCTRPRALTTHIL